MATDSILGRLTPTQVMELTKAFMEFDLNRNGFITVDEMRESLRRANMSPSDAEIYQVMAKMDFNRDGVASYDEFMRFMSTISHNLPYHNQPWR
ncbi:unnamed protein product [Rotaria sp. Silwood1]|nr:unnamed protein product [Rotaria sp. Silwood1]CAF4890775.1 unnamed protein product [Rotaria sp. Silwood1]